MLEYPITPNRTAIEFQDACEALKADPWYLHRKDNDASQRLRPTAFLFNERRGRLASCSFQKEARTSTASTDSDSDPVSRSAAHCEAASLWSCAIAPYRLLIF